MKDPWQWIQTHVSRLRRSSAGRTVPLKGTALLLGTSRSVPAPEGWRFLTVATVDEAESVLAGQEVPVVLYDRDVFNADWKRAVHRLAGSHGHPSVVLVASAGNQPGWDEVAAAGGYDVLREPVCAEALERTLRAASSHWRNRREIETESRRARATR